MKGFRRMRSFPRFLAAAAAVGFCGACSSTVRGPGSSFVEPAGPPDDLVDAATREALAAYLEDIDQWILTLDVGSGTLKGTKELSTSIFINGNFARVLMASYTLTRHRPYLDEALRWCDGFCRQQEAATTSTGEPAGFWSDLGPGRNIYFGDGGTAATALAIGWRFADDTRRATYLDAMEKYARFVLYGCDTAPPGRGRDATPTWVIAAGPSKGALGCGYYAGHLSVEPYTISTATTGASFFATLYSITNRETHRDVARGAAAWLLTMQDPDGEMIYTLDGKVEKQWPLDTLAYCTEGFVAADFHLRDPALQAKIRREIRPILEWYLRGQNADGSWGALRSPDQQRSPRAVTLLTWYYRNVERDPRVAEAVRRYVRFLLDPANSRAYGVKELVRTTGFVGLTVAEILKDGCTF